MKQDQNEVIVLVFKLFPVGGKGTLCFASQFVLPRWGLSSEDFFKELTQLHERIRGGEFNAPRAGLG